MRLIGNIIDLELESDFVFISVHVNHTSVSESKMNLEIQLVEGFSSSSGNLSNEKEQK